MKAEGLQLRIAGRVLIDGLNWHVASGECWCVIGRNGAGKSTLLRTLAGLREADGGRVLLQEKPLSEWPLAAVARERAYLPQGRSDAFGYRVIETVLSARHPYHEDAYWESESDFAAAHAALHAMDVNALSERDVRSLSGGERQRVAIAAVLAQDAPLMLLDEPANALDLAHQVGVMRLLARLCTEEKKSVVMVSHDLNLAYGIATHALLLMGDGKWHAGPAHAVLTPSLLGDCLGHPIDMIRHGERVVFVAAEERHG